MNNVRRVLSSLAAVFVLSIAAHAFAEGAQELVLLIDGSEIQGELVEKVVGDHVTVRLATGEVRKIPWSDVKNSTTLAPGMPQLPAATPPANVPTNVGAGAYGEPDAIPGVPTSYDTSVDSIHGLPEPDRRPPPLDESASFIGISGGGGMPVGTIGVVGGYDTKYWELEFGAGTGGTFGYALSAMARLHAPLGTFMRMGLGLGYSLNFLTSSQTSPTGQYAFAPTTARFLNLELYQDYPIGRTVILRLTSGVGFLMGSRSDYLKACAEAHGGEGCPEDTGFSLATSPRNLGEPGHSSPLMYFGAEILWRF